jgi:nucleotide-binding universal stress UspA family protein
VAVAYTKILVGYDGSENSKRALDRAIALSEGTGAAIRLVVAVSTVLITYGPTAYYPPDYAEQALKEGGRLLSDAVGRAKAAGRNVSGSVEDGHPAEILLDCARREGADLIVVGRRGISGIERFVMGGVSSSVVNHSTCDVLVVK